MGKNSSKQQKVEDQKEEAKEDPPSPNRPPDGVVDRSEDIPIGSDEAGHTRPQLGPTIIEHKKSNALLVAAIDFGTTYSGYAYSFIKNPDEILTNYWDHSSIKTPTVVLMDPSQKFHSFGEEAKHRYERLIRRDKHKDWYLFERFKMKLFVKGHPLTKDMKIDDILGKPVKAITVFTAAIRFIKDHLLGVLNDQRRTDHVKIEKDTDIKWVLTVPAIWGDLSKTFMRDAAKDAGIPDDMLLLALEPEAASIFCKKELGVVQVPVGCRYLVLDLGGGTADITCHEVNYDGTLKELYPPTGGDFGGTTVDNYFLSILLRIFGGDIINQFKKCCMNEYWELMSDFELKKRKFGGSGRVVLKFPVRLLELYEDNVGMTVEDSLRNSTIKGHVDFKHGKLFITENMMRVIFNSAVTKILDKTDELLREVSEIDSILLVGGFSESPYLQQMMTVNFDNRIVLPREPAGAVLKGAVMYGHQTNAISSRKCRYTYGIARMERFNSKIHPFAKMIRLGEFTFCDDIFNKHIEIGTEVSVYTPEEAEAHEYFPSTAYQKHAVLEVYKSTKWNPKFIDEDGCELVGLIKVDIDPKGNVWSTLMVRLIFGGTELIVELKDVTNGTITEAKVDFLG